MGPGGAALLWPWGFDRRKKMRVFKRIVGYHLSLGSIFELYEDVSEEEIMSNFSNPERAEEIIAVLEKRLIRLNEEGLNGE